MRRLVWPVQPKSAQMFATIDGYVKFEHLTRDKKQISVYPEAQ